MYIAESKLNCKRQVEKTRLRLENEQKDAHVCDKFEWMFNASHELKKKKVSLVEDGSASPKFQQSKRLMKKNVLARVTFRLAIFERRSWCCTVEKL